MQGKLKGRKEYLASRTEKILFFLNKNGLIGSLGDC